MLVASTILLAVLLAILGLFDLSGRVARSQGGIADLHQSLRIAQRELVHGARMAGRGGLPLARLPQGAAVAVRNDAPESGADHFIARDDPSSPEIVPGSDVLVVRGVFDTPVYHVADDGADFVLDDPTGPSSGWIRVRDPSPRTGVSQDLTALEEAIENGRPEALLLVGGDGATHAVVELDPSSPDSNVTADAVTIGFRVTGGIYSGAYSTLSAGGVFPPGLDSAVTVGLLEEIRYYVRQEYVVPGDATSGSRPALSSAIFYPATESAYAGDSSGLQVDIADNVLDLQVALGVDRDGDQGVTDNHDGTDEWLYNSAEDDDAEAGWGDPEAELFYLRISTLARTDRPDHAHLDSPIETLEDHRHGETDPPADESERRSRRYRRRLMTTIVDLRNVR